MHDLDQALVEPQVLRGPAAGNDQGIVVGGIDGCEISIDGKVVAGLLAVSLIALESRALPVRTWSPGCLSGQTA